METPPVFGWSTPAPGFDGQPVRPWRVSHADVLTSHLATIGYPSTVAYVEYDRDRLWVGIRDNRNEDAHLSALLRLSDQLRADGLRVKSVVHRGRIRALHVVDTVPS